MLRGEKIKINKIKIIIIIIITKTIIIIIMIISSISHQYPHTVSAAEAAAIRKKRSMQPSHAPTFLFR